MQKYDRIKIDFLSQKVVAIENFDVPSTHIFCPLVKIDRIFLFCAHVQIMRTQIRKGKKRVPCCQILARKPQETEAAQTKISFEILKLLLGFWKYFFQFFL